MAIDVIKPLDPEFNGVSVEILRDSRYMPHLKNCIGAIDGVHVQATISPGDQVPYIGRKGTPTQNMCSYLRPYKGERYHLPAFRRGREPTRSREVFNHRHSSLRSVIERTFGVWKKRWNILRDMPNYPFKKQVKIIIATMMLHNYIRRYGRRDNHFDNMKDDLDDDTGSDEE
ncbi:uncharacterized protein [Pyrus communis]|uniref:uncharacterized protein n=1 Tax=Pyrus communis TaxID=23211 RepID=UPI0035C20AFC